MGGNGEQRGSSDASGPVRPGALTSLLQEIAQGKDEAPEAAWDRPLGPGTVVGRFEIVRELGRGGFGVVYEARDRELGRAVAFKAVRAGGREDLRQERLWREAEAAARLTHPNIVTLYDAGRSERGPFLVLELLRGQTLAERLEQGAIGLREAMRIGVEVARGVAHAHAQGVVHRDLKPANVFLCEDGQVKVLDFGLAHAFGRRRAAGGTPAYMAPEQWKGAPEDERTDVFALGVMLHRMLAGALPFPEGSDGAPALGRKAPRLEVPDVPALGELIGRMLEVEPVHRPRDCGEVLSALAVLQREAERSSATGPGPVRTRRSPRLRLAALAAAGVALGAAVAALALRGRVPEPAAGPVEPVTVAVADFANETRDPELDGLSGLLITSLEQSKALRVLTRSRMFDLLHQLGKERVERIDETLARELGKRAGIQALLLASVRRFDDVYAVEMRALNPVRDEYLFTVKEQVTGKRAIPGAIDRLSEQTRRNFRESERDVAAGRRGVAEVTTGDLAAWEHFFRGRQALDLRQFDKAAEELKASVAADPDFALAHYQIAVLDAWIVKPGHSNEASIRTAAAHLETAVRLADRLPEKERLALLAWKATWERQPEEARRLRDQAAAAYPQDKEAVFWAGDIRFHNAQVAEAVPWFERALQLDPDYRLVQEHIVLALAQLDRPKEELQWARRWAASARDPDSLRALGHALLAGDQREEAEAVFRQASALDGRYAMPPALASWLLHHGRAAEAERRLRRALEALPATDPDDEKGRMERVTLVNGLLATLVHQGRLREARQLVGRLESMGLQPLDAARTRTGFASGTRSAGAMRAAAQELERLGGLQDAPSRFDLAIGFAVAGDVPAAEQQARAALAAAGVAEIPPQARAGFDALIAWRKGRLEEAEASLRAMADHSLAEVRYKVLSALGELRLERGRPREAAEALERARAVGLSAGMGAAAYLQAEDLFHLAVANDRLGEKGKARERVEELLRQWKRADPDLPRLSEARALRARLAAAAPARRGT